MTVMIEMDSATKKLWANVINLFRDKGSFKYLGATYYPYTFAEFGGQILIACPSAESLRHELSARYGRSVLNGDSS